MSDIWLSRRIKTDLSVRLSVLYQYNFNLCHIFRSIGGRACADPEGGPWDLSGVGSYVDVWLVGEGFQRLFLSYYKKCSRYTLASIIHSVNILKTKTTSKFKWSHLLWSSPRSSSCHPWLLWNCISMFLSKITLFYGSAPVEHSYLACMVLVTRPCQWYNDMTSICDLVQCQHC